MGTLPQDVAERRAILEELQSTSSAGRDRRRAFQEAIRNTTHEFHGLGTEMGQLYESSAVYTADEANPFKPTGLAAQDPVLHYERSTYPGFRLPHVWLNRAVPGKPISTIDLAGKGCFTLFTGIGGGAWKSAAERASLDLEITVKVYSIGFRQDWEDVYFDWEQIRGVEESGAVLVRPDRFVAWRAASSYENQEECYGKLIKVLREILGKGIA